MTLCGEGSNASSTNKESDLSQSSRERRNSDTQSERKLRRSEGSSMLINDPLGEGSNASSINQGEQSIGCRGIREDQEGRCPPKGRSRCLTLVRTKVSYRTLHPEHLPQVLPLSDPCLSSALPAGGGGA